ncbi:hypothetical protein GDO78_020102, partial [Eleutherodactylus coqui]
APDRCSSPSAGCCSSPSAGCYSSPSAGCSPAAPDRYSSPFAGCSPVAPDRFRRLLLGAPPSPPDRYFWVFSHQLALKHRQGKNHKMRIIAFVGSPVEDNEKDLVKMAKRLKKEKVSVDIINFGEEESNTEKLTAFINTLNGKDGTGSHLVTVPPGPSLADALISSPILAGEGGAMLGLGASDFEFGVDPSADPELALALRVSMEEQRQRQEEEARRAAAASAAEAGITSTAGDDSDEALLKMTIGQQEGGRSGLPDFSSMTEDEQIAYAMQMSLQGAEFGQAEQGDLDSSAMEIPEPAKVTPPTLYCR